MAARSCACWFESFQCLFPAQVHVLSFLRYMTQQILALSRICRAAGGPVGLHSACSRRWRSSCGHPNASASSARSLADHDSILPTLRAGLQPAYERFVGRVPLNNFKFEVWRSSLSRLRRKSGTMRAASIMQCCWDNDIPMVLPDESNCWSFEAMEIWSMNSMQR